MARCRPSAVCSPWDVTKHDISVGFRHTWHVYGVAVPITLVALSVLTLPTAAITRWLGETLVQVGSTTDLGLWKEPLQVDQWSEESRRVARSREAPFVFLGWHEFLGSVVGGGFWFSIVHHIHATQGGDADGEHLPAWGVAMGLATFAVHATFVSGNVVGWIDVSLAMMPLARTACSFAVWIPGLWCAGLMFFSWAERRKAFYKVGTITFVSMLGYICWFFWMTAYFRMTVRWARVLLGIALPHLLWFVFFEITFTLGCQSLERSHLVSAAVVMSVPVTFMVSTTAVMHLGAVDIASGCCIEVGSALVELMFKHCLLHGETPLERCIRWASAIRQRCKKRSAVAPARRGDATDATFSGVVPPSAQEKGGAPRTVSTALDAGIESEACSMGSERGPGQMDSQMPQASDRSQDGWPRKRLLMAIAVYSNLTEVIVQTLVAGVYIFAKLNPNEAHAPPTPHAQIVVLYSLKMALEMFTDFFVSTMAARMARPDSQCRAPDLSDAWDSLGREVQVAIGALSAFFGLEMLINHIAQLCPYPIEGTAELLSVGLCS